MFERRKQLCSGHNHQFDDACAQVNVHENLAIFYKPLMLFGKLDRVEG